MTPQEARTQMWSAVRDMVERNGNSEDWVEKAKTAIQAGADINELAGEAPGLSDDFKFLGGMTPLMCAALWDGAALAEALMRDSDAGRTARGSGLTALEIAVAHRSVSALKMLLTLDDTRLDPAMQERMWRLAIVGVRENEFAGDAAIAQACLVEVAKRVSPECWENDALLLARVALSLDAADVLRLAAQKCDLNGVSRQHVRPDESALIHAVDDGARECVKELLAMGFDANAPGWKGTLPLVEASKRSDCDLIKILLPFADVNAADGSGKTALMVVAEAEGFLDEEKNEILRILLNAGANPDACDNHGKTALHRAADALSIQILGAVSNVSIKDKKGHTAFESAFLDNAWDQMGHLAAEMANAGMDVDALILKMVHEKAPKLAALSQAQALRREVQSVAKPATAQKSDSARSGLDGEKESKNDALEKKSETVSQKRIKKRL